jgi:hypothetical protein
VLEVGTDLLDEGGSLAITHPTPTWGHVVALIDNEHAESPWEARCPLWDEVFEDAEDVVLLEEVVAGDQPWIAGPRIRVDALFPSEIAHRLMVDDSEVEAKLVAHLLLPLELKR